MEFLTELKKLGLKDKEASVYLSCLELGPSPVQTIARKAKVVRATTYVVLEGLMNLGLVTKFKEGKKTLFLAEPPRQLKRLLEKEEERIHQQQEELDRVLPELQMLMRSSEVKPSVRYFEGREGVNTIRKDIVMYCRGGDVVYSFTPADHLTSLFPDDEDKNYSARVAKGFRGKTIFTTKSEKVRKRWLSDPSFSRMSERRYVPPEHFPVSSGMTIYKDRIGMGSFTGDPFGVIIESEALAHMMRSLFDLSWVGAEKFIDKI